MPQKELEKVLFFHNPWWRKREVPPVLLPDFERPVLKKLQQYWEKLERIIVIKGPRRTGKTTLIYQMINSLLQSGKDPFDILFLSFDDPALQINLEKILETYQGIRGKTIDKPQIYCFLDEVHFLDNWEFIVKKYFDKKYPIKFLVSSSSASLLRQGTESLAGRTVEETILPFSFKELTLYHFRRDNHFFDFLKKKQLTPYEDEIKLLFKDYLLRGGFPHLLSVREPILWHKLLKEDVLEKVIYRDLVSLYNIREPQKLEKIFSYLADISGQILNISSLAKNVGLSRVYCKNYLTYLEKAYLIFRFNNFGFSSGKKLRGASKIYLIDSGLINCFSDASPDFILESVVARDLFARSGTKIYYARAQREVDFILEQPKKLIPLEVKNKTKLEDKDFQGIFSFMEEMKITKGILLSQNSFGEKIRSNLRVQILPVWYWLLLGEEEN